MAIKSQAEGRIPFLFKICLILIKINRLRHLGLLSIRESNVEPRGIFESPVKLGPGLSDGQ